MVNTPEELGAWLRLVLTPGVRGAAAAVIGVIQRHLLVPVFGVP